MTGRVEGHVDLYVCMTGRVAPLQSPALWLPYKTGLLQVSMSLVQVKLWFPQWSSSLS